MISFKSFAGGLFCVATSATAFGCGLFSDDGPASYKVTEIETTIEQGGDTEIHRSSLVYEGDQIAGVEHFRNGESAGRHEFTYRGSKVETIIIFDAEGDRATSTRTYDDDHLQRHVLDVPSWFSQQSDYRYDDDLAKEITTRTTAAGSGESSTTYSRFEYEDSLLSRVTDVDSDNDSSTTEFRYDGDGRVDRIMQYNEGSLLDTYEYTYDDDGRLYEVFDNDDNRYTVSYDGDARIAQIDYFGASGFRSTTRYTYASGSVEGFSFSPALPGIFDLSGQSYGRPLFDHMSFNAPEDFPTPVDDDPDPDPDLVCGYDPADACEECFLTDCCSEVTACQNSYECLDYIDCLEACDDAGGDVATCKSDCATTYPTGSDLQADLYYCAQGYCASECGL